MKIVLLEKECLGDDVCFEQLNQYGEVISYPVTSYERIGERLKEADIAIINRCRMEKETIEQCKQLKLICITGTGTDMVDLPYVKSRGIVTSNVRGYSTQSVAQHTFAMLFYLLEHLRFYDDFVKEGKYVWEVKQEYSTNRFWEIAGKTWGICGLGAIGKEVAKIATTFGCRVIYYSTSGKNTCTEYTQVDFDTLLKQSDVLSVHAPLTKESKGLFDQKAFATMKSSSIFLNVGRGAIIEEDALIQALNTGSVAAAGLDVLIQEPMPKDSPFLSIQDSSKLLITPHIAWSSKEARQKVIDEMCLNIEAFLAGSSRNPI